MPLGHTPLRLRLMQLGSTVIHAIPSIAVIGSVLLVGVHLGSDLDTNTGAQFAWTSILTAYTYTEAAFLIHFYAQRTMLQRPQLAPVLGFEALKVVWKRILEYPDLKMFIVGWFYWKLSQHQLSINEFGEIHDENFKDWLAWVMFSESCFEDARRDESKIQEMDALIKNLKHTRNIEFPVGRNKNITNVKLNHNTVEAYPKPFIFYLVMKLLELVESLFLMFLGFDHFVSNGNGLNYWAHHPVRCDDSAVPLVFIHGIGVGLFQYQLFIYNLWKTQHRPIFLVELPYVSMRLSARVPTVEETVTEIEGMLEAHGFSSAHIVGHSWGTAVAAWMIKLSKFTVSSVLLDPIVFFAILPDLAFNFVHRNPGHNTKQTRANEYIRHFSWHHNLLWPDELPVNHHIFAARDDMLFDGRAMEKYLESNEVNHTMFDLDHGTFLFMPSKQAQIMARIAKVCSDAEN
ncbi:hypothetical protein HDU99_009403 [Rhizoclosmatium hyalinum]|nr:hypothetical protein HDU99_009403 [Rhizoclosmatium hyalinum]